MTVYPISDKKHQQALCDAKRRRLQVLELQAALHGFSVPPHIPIEIDELLLSLGDYKKSLKDYKMMSENNSNPFTLTYASGAG